MLYSSLLVDRSVQYVKKHFWSYRTEKAVDKGKNIAHVLTQITSFYILLLVANDTENLF